MTERKVDPFAEASNVCYEDTGCDLSPSCLECPFPYCVKHESRHVKGRRRNHERDRQICRAFKDGKSVAEIAGAMYVSKRIVQRVIRAGRPSGR